LAAAGDFFLAGGAGFLAAGGPGLHFEGWKSSALSSSPLLSLSVREAAQAACWERGLHQGVQQPDRQKACLSAAPGCLRQPLHGRAEAALP
jgi:hypothetical protein